MSQDSTKLKLRLLGLVLLGASAWTISDSAGAVEIHGQILNPGGPSQTRDAMELWRKRRMPDHAHAPVIGSGSPTISPTDAH